MALLCWAFAVSPFVQVFTSQNKVDSCVDGSLDSDTVLKCKFPFCVGRDIYLAELLP